MTGPGVGMSRQAGQRKVEPGEKGNGQAARQPAPLVRGERISLAHSAKREQKSAQQQAVV